MDIVICYGHGQVLPIPQKQYGCPEDVRQISPGFGYSIKVLAIDKLIAVTVMIAVAPSRATMRQNDVFIL